MPTSSASRDVERGRTFRTVAVYLVAIVAAVALVYAGRLLYAAADKPLADFKLKLGELALQLAVIAIVGGLAKALIDWGAASRAREIERLEKRMDFLRRVRAAHVIVASARELINAHETAKTYGEQIRRLMTLRFEVAEILEDVNASGRLFRNPTPIADGLEAMTDYLEEGAKEYQDRHRLVDRDFHGRKTDSDRRTLRYTIANERMVWVDDLLNAGKKYEKEYVVHLRSVKQHLRAETYQG